MEFYNSYRKRPRIKVLMAFSNISSSTNKYVFSNILKAGSSRGHIAGKTDEAIKWYRNAAKNFGSVSRNRLLREKSQIRTTIEPGSMYMFAYDAKHKDTLPYYDAFPIIFPIRLLDDGFLGLNFHYLQPNLRAMLMDSLYTLNTDPKISQKSKIVLSYQLLRSASQFKYFKPCLKRYLYSQFRSKFVYVDPATWDIALFLPTEQFKGATNSQVWADSRGAIL
jgi:hypothetical protein